MRQTSGAAPDIRMRRIPFPLPDTLEPVWNPARHEWSHMVNGASLAMPYLEPFLIATMREAMQQIKDPELRRQIFAFNAQEGQHFRMHRRYNDILKARYPGLAQIEDAMTASYARLQKKSLQTRMAYTAGFESMTLGLTKWLIEDRRRLFHKSDTHVASFVLWHMVEEVEHKRVAWGVYQAVCPGYARRALGVFHGSFHVLMFARRAYIVMLKQDGRWYSWRARMRLWAMVARFLWHVVPRLIRAALPGHNPDDVADPAWVQDWIEAYTREGDTPGVPALDTADADIPPPFAPAAAQA